eukprot:UN15752
MEYQYYIIFRYDIQHFAMAYSRILIPVFVIT